MSVSKGRQTATGRLLCGAAICAITITGAYAQSIEDEIVVTAQRQEQSAQDVPISVSAFSGDDLQARQLESFQDLQFNVPNFAFTRTQFTGSTISIRGIGQLAVGATTEASTSIHLNEFYVNAPRLFETEFFDIERLEILRGPQGTLFGRNATGGVVNVITRKASTDGVEGYADAEYGNFNSVKAQGALNVPLSDTIAVRLAGTVIQRDGFTENLFDGRDIDDRNIYALRGSARWLPTDNTTIDVVASYMREDDNRARYQKQACTEGPLSPLLGCDPNGPLEIGRQDLRGTFFANTSAQTFAGLISPAAAAYGLFNINTPQLGTQQPLDPREVNIDFRPKYDAEETIFQVSAKHDFETFSVKFTGGWGNSKIATRTDFDGGVGPELSVPAAICLGGPGVGLPAVCNLTGGLGANSFPLSSFDVGITGPDGRVGVIGGNVQSRSSNFQATDLSIGETDYWSAETILTTDFDSRFNFLLGVSHARSNGYADYGVNTTGLDYFAYTGGTVAAASQAFVQGCVAGGGTAATCAAGTAPPVALGAGAGAFNAAATQGFSFYVPYFFNDSEDTFLESTSAFGEIYVDITDTLKLTGGIRYNWDTKGSREREALLTSTSNAGAFPVVPFGTPSVLSLLDANSFVPCTTPGAATEPQACPGDPTGGLQDYFVNEGDFNALTGRGVLQWTPTDDLQIYASWTRGYKPGGFNPATTSTSVARTFDEEVIKAYEIGIKSNLGSSLQANLTGFYYDYSGLQISRIVSNTSVNDNTDATIWGVEGEFVWRPTDRLIANLNASYLNTEVGNFSTFDARNPTAGAPNTELVSNLSNSLDCVITRTGATPLLFQNGGMGTGVAALDGLIGGLGGVPGVGAFSNCDALAANIGTINALIPGQGYAVTLGIDQDLSGNELPGAPDFKVAGGLQYEFAVGGNYSLTPRVDAYYQSSFFNNVFNTQQDNVDGYAYVNAQVKFGPTEGNWTARFFMQNLTNEDAITGAFAAGQGAGNFTNLFLLEPRRWGVGINMVF
ncbi:MAG: TonB-dependent receptor [Parvularculaceae bacterium]|nr:TonB-dependent receptor [Parvularculaceae bacterium]